MKLRESESPKNEIETVDIPEMETENYYRADGGERVTTWLNISAYIGKCKDPYRYSIARY